jgi:hypothetical protein
VLVVVVSCVVVLCVPRFRGETCVPSALCQVWPGLVSMISSRSDDGLGGLSGSVGSVTVSASELVLGNSMPNASCQVIPGLVMIMSASIAAVGSRNRSGLFLA